MGPDPFPGKQELEETHQPHVVSLFKCVCKDPEIDEEIVQE